MDAIQTSIHEKLVVSGRCHEAQVFSIFVGKLDRSRRVYMAQKSQIGIFSGCIDSQLHQLSVTVMGPQCLMATLRRAGR